MVMLNGEAYKLRKRKRYGLPGFRRPKSMMKHGGLLDLVDELLFVIEIIPEKLQEKIGKILGEKWRNDYVSNR